MERGCSSNQLPKYSTGASKSGTVIQEPTNTNVTDANNLNSLPQRQSVKRQADQYMPITNITEIMRRALPPDAVIANDAKEAINTCVTEFISLITSEANAKCHSEYRKIVTAEDVLLAMGKLRFDNYIEPLTTFLLKYRSADPNSSMSTTRKRNLGWVHTAEAQVARPPPMMDYKSTSSGMYVPQLANNHARLPQIGDYHMANEGGGEGSSASLKFDPFLQFKK